MVDQFKRFNNIGGWLMFIIASVVYILTIEPTASFWDCGEFISTAYKLEVGHPPGAPFFMLLGRFFTLFASGPESVAVMINILSALCSAATIMFLFWSVTHIGKRIASKEGKLSIASMIAVLGAGAVGALAYTFSDTFWYSAVEGEVYAMSSLFTAVVFWGILKWEDVSDEPGADRWIVFLAYMMGLSVGVHLLNLLAIPAMGLIYYFRRYKITKKGTFLAILISGVILLTIMYLIIPGIIKMASWFELLFVNGIGMPFNSGTIIYAFTILFGLSYLIWLSHKRGSALLNTAVLSILMIVIGYFSFATIIIRAASSPPMNQNDPDNVFSLLSYVNREQYGDRPLLYGKSFDSGIDYSDPYVKGDPYYAKKDGKYYTADERISLRYLDETNSLFPRMYSNQPSHVEQYKAWVNIKGKKVKVQDANGQMRIATIPTFGENLSFLFNYQINWMYFRYFMWNFSGRQNDIQGEGGNLKGNWISGISFIDNARLGDQSTLPAKWSDNKANNKYYMLPLILGLLGMAFLYANRGEGERYFYVLLIFFLMTGVAIVVYLNQTPLQPRERDYAFAGSFYAFSLFIGLGVLFLHQLLKRHFAPKSSAILVTILSLLVPTLMAFENWDDHSRAGRYTVSAVGNNYLETVAENGVIFTNGDNDTFPLWYMMDVENKRLDTRTCNLSYLQTDWYIRQMKSFAYESAPLPISFTEDQFVQGTNDVVYIVDNPNIKERVELSAALDFVKSDKEGTKLREADNASFFPTRKLKYTVDKEAVIRNGVVSPDMYDQIVDEIEIDLTGRQVTKDQLMVLDMLANSNWERPFYFAITVPSDKYSVFTKYLRQDGFAYRLVPLRFESNSSNDIKAVNVDQFISNIETKYKWGNMNGEGVYLDETHRRMAISIRSSFIKLANTILSEGSDKIESAESGDSYKLSKRSADLAVALMDSVQNIVPDSKIPFRFYGSELAKVYIQAGDKDKGIEIIEMLATRYIEEATYIFGLSPKLQGQAEGDLRESLYFLNQLNELCRAYGLKEQYESINGIFEQLLGEAQR